MKMNTIGKLLSYINRLHQKKLAQSFKPYGMGSGGHHSYLLAILKRPGVNQDQLTNDLKFDKATTARSVQKLEQEGYIERHVDPNDRRAYLLYPTERAKTFEPILYQTLQEANERLTSSLSVEEKEQLWKLLNKIYHNNNE